MAGGRPPCLHLAVGPADERNMLRRRTLPNEFGVAGHRTLRSDEMSGWVELGDGVAGFAVGLFLHAVPASWWPRWLGKLVGKVR
jgi:hypothetical protein